MGFMKYLPVPVSYDGKRVKLRIFSGQELLRDLDVAYEPVSPDMVFSYPLEREGLRFTVDGKPYGPELLDEPVPVSANDEALRPVLHFTAPAGWLNDPNGCYRYGDGYFLFYQHNPLGPQWGNMHWGRAVSKDLVSWERLPTALYPDENGTVYSGSAAVDYDGVSGLGDGGNPPILLFYTAAGNKNEISRGVRFTQRLAYSTDGGETFKKRGGPPLVPWLVGENRDPKVVPDGEGGFVCALFLEGDEYALYRSKNLLDWELTQKLRLPGDGECPDLFPLPYKGGTKWVFSGAGGRYLTGELSGGVFTPDSPEPRKFGFDFGTDSYAAQTFFDPGGEVFRIAWLRWRRVGAPTLPFASSMTLPVSLGLTEANGTVYLRAEPVSIDKYVSEAEFDPVFRGDELKANLPEAPFELTMKFSENPSFQIRLANFEPSYDDGVLDYAGVKTRLPVAPEEIKIVVDRFSVELYACDGLLLLASSASTLNYPAFSCRLLKGTKLKKAVLRS